MTEAKAKDKRFDADDEFTLLDVKEAMETTERVRIARNAVQVDMDSWDNTIKTLANRDEMGALMFVSNFNHHIEEAVLYDPWTGLYAVVSGHKHSEAMNYVEHDWKVRSVGETLTGETNLDDFESEEDANGWVEWFVGEAVKYDEHSAIYSTMPGKYTTVTINDSGVYGLKGDSFGVRLVATDE